MNLFLITVLEYFCTCVYGVVLVCFIGLLRLSSLNKSNIVSWLLELCF